MSNMIDRESSLPAAVAQKAIELAQASPHRNVCVLQLTDNTQPHILLSTPSTGASIASLDDLREILGLTAENEQELLADRSLATPNADITSTQVAGDGCSYLIWVYTLRPDSRPCSSGPTIQSLAAASWMSSFVHAICQPLHVLKNVADLLELKADAGEITGEALPKFLNMARKASKDAEQKIAAVKAQFATLDDDQQSVNVKKHVEAFFARYPFINVDCDSNGDSDSLHLKDLHVEIAPVRLHLLFSCLAELVHLSHKLGSHGARTGRIVVDAEAENMRLRLELPCAICVSHDVLAASNSVLLATAIVQSAEHLTEALFGNMDLLARNSVGGESTTNDDGEVYFDTLIFKIPTRLPDESVKIARVVRRAW